MPSLLQFFSCFPNKQRVKHILLLALPIIGGMISQNILNLVDLAMVGTLGATAVAAVGIASYINFFSFSLIGGVAAGVQATAARRFGEKKFNETALPLNTGLAISLCIGIPLSILLYIFANDILQLMINDPAVVAEGTPYLQTRGLVIALVGMNFAFRGYWNAIQLAKLYMFTLLAMHSINILLNYLLIFGNWGFPALGTHGAAIGTSISILLGTATYIVLGFRYAGQAGFMKLLPNTQQVKRLVSISIPNSIQQMTFAAGLTCFLWIISLMGTNEMAVANILMNLVLVAVLPALGFGLASASLVGKSLGENDITAARQWTGDIIKIASVVFLAISILAINLSEQILGLFIHQQDLIDLGKLPLQLVALAAVIDSAGLIIMQSLLGAGATRRVMQISIFLQWGFQLPIAYILTNFFGVAFIYVWILFIAHRVIQTLCFVQYWQKGQWSNTQL